MATTDVSLSIEKQFLAYLFKNKYYINLSLSKISNKHFLNEDTRKVYNLIIGFYNNYGDVLSDKAIQNKFKKQQIDNAAVINYTTIIASIRSLPIVNQADFESLIDEMIDNYRRSQLINIASNIASTNPRICGRNKLVELEGNIEKTMVDLTLGKFEMRDHAGINESVDQRIDDYKLRRDDPSSIKLIPTGFKLIDEVEGGFAPSELVYIIGRKGDGKSVVLLNMAKNMWANGYNIAIFSLEIQKKDYERRIDSSIAGIPSTGIKLGKLTPVEEALYENYANNLKNNLTPEGNPCGYMHVFDVSAGITAKFIESQVSLIERKKQLKFDVIISDYADLMQPSVRIPDYNLRHVRGAIALELKKVARDRNYLVISAAQMNRAGGDSTRAGTEHVAESDQVVDHLDWGMAVRKLSDSTGKIESFKTRDGAPFEFHFSRRFDLMRVMPVDESIAAWDNIQQTQ